MIDAHNQGIQDIEILESDLNKATEGRFHICDKLAMLFPQVVQICQAGGAGGIQLAGAESAEPDEYV